MIFDLHIHTTFSDGEFSPDEVLQLANKRRINGIAITDHDTVNGIKPTLELGKKYRGLHIIPGIELGTLFEDEEVHILGYFVDYTSKTLIEATEMLKLNRIKRGIKIVEKLNYLGMELSYEIIKEFTKDGFIGRPHIAKALLEKGYVKSVEEAFKRLLNRGKPAYVQRETLTLKETINLIHKVDGIAILAHPGLLKNKSIISKCIYYGVDGLEAIHSKHDKKDVKVLLDIARANNMIVTGGSDFHGRIVDGDYLLGKYYINIDDIPQMKGRL